MCPVVRTIHFALGFQYGDFNLDAIFGKLGYWFIQDSDNYNINKFKEAVTCIFCFTSHFTYLISLIIFTILFNFWWALLASIVVASLSFNVQQVLHIYIYSKYESDGSK